VQPLVVPSVPSFLMYEKLLYNLHTASQTEPGHDLVWSEWLFACWPWVVCSWWWVFCSVQWLMSWLTWNILVYWLLAIVEAQHVPFCFPGCVCSDLGCRSAWLLLWWPVWSLPPPWCGWCQCWRLNSLWSEISKIGLRWQMSPYCWRCFFVNDGDSVASRCRPFGWWILYPCPYNERVCPWVGLISCVVECRWKAWHLQQMQSEFSLWNLFPWRLDDVEVTCVLPLLGIHWILVI
jgi:hypothetical protein